MQSKSAIDYCNKLILAPMVRGSLLPFRLLALKYGADLVYTDEIIDFSLLTTKRKVNDILKTVDYVNEDNAYLLFRTSPLEKKKLVFQMGTSDPSRAVQVAKLVENDVSAIDINMGCPRKYSTSLGIGAALLSNVEKAKSIVQNLVENIQLPITCKIRISEDIDKTIRMVQDFERVGVRAVTVHGRTRYQKSSDPVDKAAIRKIAENVNIPIIANGGSSDINNLADMLKFKEECGASSVMVARAAQRNVGVFREEGPIPPQDLIVEYLKLCVEYDNSCINTKYALQIMHKSLGKLSKSKFAKEFAAAKTLEEICDFWNLGDFCREKKSEYEAKGLDSLEVGPRTRESTPIELLKSREQMFNAENVIVAPIHYKRNFFDWNTLPKKVLHIYCDRNKIPLPIYESKRSDRLHYTIIRFQDNKYASTLWHHERKHSEQAAALLCAFHLGLYEEDFLVATGSLLKFQ